jgi:hypothetical protein
MLVICCVYAEITSSSDKTQWTASTISIKLHEAFTKAEHFPPLGFCWTSHILRKGAASAAYAIKVPLTDICYAGGRFSNSTVLESKYIDFTIRPTKATLLFFGHLKKGTPT